MAFILLCKSVFQKLCVHERRVSAREELLLRQTEACLGLDHYVQTSGMVQRGNRSAWDRYMETLLS